MFNLKTQHRKYSVNHRIVLHQALPIVDICIVNDRKRQLTLSSEAEERQNKESHECYYNPMKDFGGIKGYPHFWYVDSLSKLFWKPAHCGRFFFAHQ